MQGISANVPSDRSIAVIVNVVTRVMVFIFCHCCGDSKTGTIASRENQRLRRSPTPTGFAEILSDLFPNASLSGLLP